MRDGGDCGVWEVDGSAFVSLWGYKPYNILAYTRKFDFSLLILYNISATLQNCKVVFRVLYRGVGFCTKLNN